MSVKQLFIVAGNRFASRLWAMCLRRKIVTYDDADIVREITNGVAWEDFWKTFVDAFPGRFFYSPRNRKDFFVQTLLSLHPYEEILDDANAVVQRTFDLLGSGPVTLAKPIRWNIDFKTGAAWENAFYTGTKRANAIEGGDIKIPWELGRFHYLVWLGKAYWISNSRRYADAYRELVDEWIAANPMGYGVQWDNAMEVAMRACNWIAGMAFFLEEPSLDAAFWQRMLAALWKHAEFIEDNLEVTRRSGNHLIANYTGLACIGALFHHTIEGERWLAEGVRGMERELLRQTLPDGVDYEKAIAYHRFVAEMALAVLILCRHMRVPFRGDTTARIERMCEFVMHYTRPDGSVPNIGDNDNGRLFHVRATENFLDHTALLSTAAVVFGRADFKAAAGRFAEETLWLTGAAGCERFLALDRAPQRESHAFAEGGYYVLRSSAMHCIVDAGELGKQGWGGHGHNDTLSFELWQGEPVIVDSGTYCYTADRAARDAFRGTAAHNTAMIDAIEIARFAGPFKITGDTTQPVVRQWECAANLDILEVAHHAYSHLPNPVTYARRFSFDKTTNTLTIRDTFECTGAHRVAIYLHFAAGISAERIDDGSLHLIGANADLTIQSSQPWTIESCWISPSYGMKMPSHRAVCSLSINGTTTIETQIS